MPVSAEAKRLAFERAFPPEDEYIEDHHGWVKNKLGGFLWSKQVEIGESVRDNRFTAVPACHGPGKSFDASSIATWWIDVHPPGSAMVVTTAPTDHQVKAILWREIGRRHREGHLRGRITLEAKWYFGERLVDEELCAFGRKPQDYNADAFQGIHEKYVLVLIDEACGVPKNLFDSLETLMTNDYARMLAIGNPDDPTSYFEQICRPGSGWNVIKIPVWSTPNFTGEHVPLRIREKLVSKLWVEERRSKWGVGSPLWMSKVEAEFPDITEDTLITPNQVRRAQEKEIDPVELGLYAFDVARFGSDETFGMRNQNGHVRKVYSKHKSDTVVTSNAIQMFLLSHGPEYVPAIVDVVGIGAGVVDNLKSRDMNVIPFNSSDRPFDPRRFRNRRAECYWNLRELFERGELDIDPHDDELASQLGSIKWFIDKWGRINIESKDDMKRRGLPSPDRADALMMACSALHMGNTVTQIPLPTVTGGLLSEVM